ncbi:HlyD family secretion protein [Cellulosilyticum sp. I15G10I2]|uniref:HlyD family secretion protein n=1 Tax=Cellulosilyticum sp. I15G10I2 TaxID=1892843 RepID=UPI00085CA15B|nr:HlyD family secretion protein [Cellulosilyticum sp. I15G10I2]
MKTLKLGNGVKIISICCIVSLLTACGGRESEPANNVTYTEYIDSDKQELDVYGNVNVAKNQEIIIDFQAIVKEVYIKDGEIVNKGDKLLSLDFEDYKLQIKTKENEIHMDEIKLKELEANNNPQMLEASRIREELKVKQNYVISGEDPDLKPLQNSLEIIEQSILLASNEYEANKQLFEVDYISEETLKLSEQKLKNRQKEKEDTLTAIEKVKTNRKLEISSLNTQLKSTEIQFNNADQQKVSSIEALKLKIATSKLMLTSMKNKLDKPYLKDNAIIAPEDNLIIYDINCMKGTEINSGMGAVLKAMYQDTIYVTADIPEESIRSVRTGQSARITLADEIKEEIIGSISRVSERAIEKDGDTIIEAIIEIEKGKALLKPGLTADIKIILR